MNEKRKTICIIANGEKPIEKILKDILEQADLVIAADGGSAICRELGILPDIIVGDFDSLKSITADIFPDSEIIEVIDQEHSDLEKALDVAISYEPECVHIMAASGLRGDHYLANILLLNNLELSGRTFKSEIYLYDNWGRMSLLEPGRHKFHNRKGQTVSFFSLGTLSKLTLKGFQYNLEDAFSKGNFTGLSNVIEEDECLLEFRGSKMLWYECFAEKEKLDNE
ncbi:MAG: thiamine diphosphokinase [Candidatus Cloacimonetes bacterium]|nr:thiamine diphosphokinase [Candidatus Cloacimonadota bacterium]